MSGSETVDTARCVQCTIYTPVGDLVFGAEGQTYCIYCGPPPAADSSRSLVGPHGIEAAASTEYGGFMDGAQSTENFLLAADDGDGRLIAAVCSGNEKHTSTMVAGAIALRELYEHVCGQQRSDDLHGDVERALLTANHRIRSAAHGIRAIRKWQFGSAFRRRIENLRGIGTSVTAAAISNRRLVVGHVGECSAFLFRNGRLTRLSSDHTLRAQPDYREYLRANPDLGDDHGDVVLKVLGMSKEPKVDYYVERLARGDVVLLGTALLAKLDLERLVGTGSELPSVEISRRLTAETKLQGRPDLAATHVVLRIA